MYESVSKSKQCTVTITFQCILSREDEHKAFDLFYKGLKWPLNQAYQNTPLGQKLQGVMTEFEISHDCVLILLD